MQFLITEGSIFQHNRYSSSTSWLILVNTCIHIACMCLCVLEGFRQWLFLKLHCIRGNIYALLCSHSSFTTQVAYHTPPRFPIDVIETIREGASLLFRRLGLRDFARIDGWFLPNSVHTLSSSKSKYGKTELGNIIFTDINLVSWVSDILAALITSFDFSYVFLIDFVIHIRSVEWSRPAFYFSKLQR